MAVQDILIIILIGISAGMLSGMVGIGGGIILVPALVYFLGYTQHQAQGTSLGVLTFPVVILGFLTYFKECRQMGVPIDFRIVGIIAIGFIAGAYFGSHIAIRIDRVMLKKFFGILLLFTALKMLDLDKLILNGWRKLW